MSDCERRSPVSALLRGARCGPGAPAPAQSPDHAEQAPLVARSVTPPSPPTSPSETMERGDDTASAACTSILGALGVQSAIPIPCLLYDPPEKRRSRGPVPCAESTLSQCNSATVRSTPPHCTSPDSCAHVPCGVARGVVQTEAPRRDPREKRGAQGAENSIHPVQKKELFRQIARTRGLTPAASNTLRRLERDQHMSVNVSE